ncbi:hypothetical protein EUTSA_v10002053mg [Eutrema salsugineum]|uniref:CAAX prenyl protease 2/Lysostaphin resistance protein A-like domain-containing protein n=1 Tax=Eutrema salsugineum TaxID=72664 RepID=V4MD88_EUTSA|nr:uncharacterized protein LOC18025562 [Eutrema salsugineum]ESQ50463.1 hypothetical protein EUTSA_v10002053mg [Eutrema salsugineum]
MILSQWVSFTPVAWGSDGLLRRYSEFRGLSSATCRLRSRPSLRCSCLKSKSTQESTELENEGGFSALASEIPWEEKNIWSTLAVYMFCLHIPLSFGGLSIVARILHQRLLDPQTQVLSLVFLQMVELTGTVLLLRNTAKPECRSINFLKGNNDSREGRNWVVGSAMGLGCLVGFIFLTSLVADQLFGSKAVQNSELEKIMASGEVSRSGCFALYCLVAPMLEEIVYRRYLLSSLASRMEWRKALVISSGVFAAAHFSGEDLVQLFGIGCVLGACYSWSGKLASSVVVHSLYNALTLLLTLRS